MSSASPVSSCAVTSIRGNRLVLNAEVATAADTAEAAAPVEVLRTDYTPLPYTVSETKMEFDIYNGSTTVTTELKVVKNGDGAGPSEFVLDGEEEAVKLLEIMVNGAVLEKDRDYVLAPGKLVIQPDVMAGLHAGEEEVVLKTVVEITPEENTQLSGLYKSGNMYCSQCGAMGFRRITYYPDRPDNMSVFTSVRIEADKEEYPILLSNGNLIKEGKAEDGRHYAVWQDPFAKPSYLFAVVAGNLAKLDGEYVTKSGRTVTLQIFTELTTPISQLDYAMDSLIKSMKWDEDVYNLEYDLDMFNIVAVGDFNMGAMENKGLNIFNTAYVLASPQTATDSDYMRVEGVIGHEYFHNWTGNRVTCRDWFQLTLKEGLTVFRDQEFSADMNSRSVKRIQDARSPRGGQFAQDAGPLSHPIRPDSYISMDNFYTATVYSKGAEVIRMYQTILGVEGFKKGMKLYFERHDGSAVTCDDFLQAMSDANDYDLTQFADWYSTKGTPTVTYFYEMDKEDGLLKIHLSQITSSEKPLHIPISIGVLDKSTGNEVVETTVLHLQEMSQTFELKIPTGVDVVPSILRGFSAPVKLIPDEKLSDEEVLNDLAYLAAYETDGFIKWESAQVIYTKIIFETLSSGVSSDEIQSELAIYAQEAFERTLLAESADQITDHAMMAYALTLPSESGLSEDYLTAEGKDAKLDPVAIRSARGKVKEMIARKYYNQISDLYNHLTNTMGDAEFKVDAMSVGRRSLRNVLLSYICAVKDTPKELEKAATIAFGQFESGSGMTDRISALNELVNMDTPQREKALKIFYDDAEGDALVLNKWFSVQALASVDDVLDRVKALTKHPDFNLANPNRCRSLISAFAMNSAPFHAEDGSGYKFLGDTIADLDKLNPQISSRMASSLIQWRRYDDKRATSMRSELEKLKSMEKISDDLFEVVSRGLK